MIWLKARGAPQSPDPGEEFRDNMVTLPVTSARCRRILSRLYKIADEETREAEVERWVDVYRALREGVPTAPPEVLLALAVKLENKRLGREAARMVERMWDAPPSGLARAEMNIVAWMFGAGWPIWAPPGGAA